MPKKKKAKKETTVVSSVKDSKPSSSELPSNLLLPASKISPKKCSVEELLPGFIGVVHNFLTDTECQAWIDLVETQQTLEYVQHPASRYMAHRECFRWQRNDNRIADTLFERIQQCGVLPTLAFPNEIQPRACNPNIRLYKYEKGMSFGKHIDESNAVAGIGQTEVTVLVYLSDCQGGATRFYHPTGKKKEKSIAFSPQKGAMLLHIHGDRCLEHEADPVVQGLKYILRTDVVYGV
ncbi:P4Hc [Seminavis robusta]|uniref:P4Hc n=1 Tax=Seminavis robusta TaxID=568900 RepID=A0A9N8DFI2_9STRA|nr:P4Hc [Seminavis robusta]|eukprot:Sro132_g062770.1 P4Hc (236) ;mRNA; r:96152-96859